MKCPDCHGLGEYAFPEGAAGPPMRNGWYDCPACKGTRVAETDRRWLLFACQRCAEQAVKDEDDHSRRKYTAQLAGPITGISDLNRRAFADAAEKVTALGYEVWNPNDWSELSPDIDPESQPREFWMRRSIGRALDADLLVMLPGWLPSEGAKCERDVAQQFGLPVVYWSEHPHAYRCEWRR